MDENDIKNLEEMVESELFVAFCYVILFLLWLSFIFICLIFAGICFERFYFVDAIFYSFFAIVAIQKLRKDNAKY